MLPAVRELLDRPVAVTDVRDMQITDLLGRALLDGPERILADIRDAEGIALVIADRQPDIVFHAATLKHLTMLKRHPARRSRPTSGAP